jgi:hypothetical protein
MDSQLQRCRFQNIPLIQEQSLSTVPKRSFLQCVQQCYSQQTHCTNSNGDYFEKHECPTTNKLSSYLIINAFCKLLDMLFHMRMCMSAHTHMNTHSDLLVVQHNGAFFS